MSSPTSTATAGPSRPVQMDQGEPDHKVALGLLGERGQDPSLGRDKLLPDARLVEGRPQKPAYHHGSHPGHRRSHPFQGRPENDLGCSGAAHSKSRCQ